MATRQNQLMRPAADGGSATPSSRLRAATPVSVPPPVPRATSKDEASPPSPVDAVMPASIVIKRSALGAFGWLLLGALLFGGIGVLVYVALGERGERGRSSSLDRGPEAGDPGDRAAPDPAEAPMRGSAGDEAMIDPSDGRGPKEPRDPKEPKDPKDAAGSGDDRPSPTHPPTPPKATPKVASRRVAVVDDKNPRALLKAGQGFEKAREWDQARAVYAKLEKLKGFGQEGAYRQAWAAFSANDTSAAVTLANRAGNQAGPFRTDARFLYGDALFRLGEYKRARDVFVGLHRALQGDPKATAQRKVAACNRQLKLPEMDGLVGK